MSSVPQSEQRSSLHLVIEYPVCLCEEWVSTTLSIFIATLWGLSLYQWGIPVVRVLVLVRELVIHVTETMALEVCLTVGTLGKCNACDLSPARHYNMGAQIKESLLHPYIMTTARSATFPSIPLIVKKISL